MKSFISLFLVIILAMGCLTACGISELFPTEPDPTEATLPAEPTLEVLEFYVSFVEMQKIDFIGAYREYGHFEDPEGWEKIENCQEVIYECEIICVEKMSSNLWTVEFFYKSKEIPLGAYILHYVGVIDGEYRVMNNLRHVPPELSDGLDLKPYWPHGPGIPDGAMFYDPNQG